MLNKQLLYFFAAISVIALSCNPTRRATNKFYKAVKLDRVTTGNNCYDVFPTKDSTIIKTDYKQGETIRDTFTEVQIEVLNDTVYLTKTIRSFRVDTAYLNVTKSFENTAKIDYLREVNGKNVILADRLKQGRNNWRTMALSCMGLIVLWGVWQIVKLYRI